MHELDLRVPHKPAIKVEEAEAKSDQVVAALRFYARNVALTQGPWINGNSIQASVHLKNDMGHLAKRALEHLGESEDSDE